MLLSGILFVQQRVLRFVLFVVLLFIWHQPDAGNWVRKVAAEGLTLSLHQELVSKLSSHALFISSKLAIY